MTLAECLRGSPASGRRAICAAYWLASERAAKWNALAQSSQWLQDLAPVLLDRGAQAACAMLQARTARLGTDAAQADARAALVEAQFELARSSGRAGDGSWPLPSTPPFAGQFTSAPQQAQAAGSWPLRRLAATIPGRSEHVKQQAQAAAEADAQRAESVAGFRVGRQSLERVLDNVESQTGQTFAYLEALTAYNQAIAEYATLTLPADASPDAFAAALAPR
jgi:hypothetical protein